MRERGTRLAGRDGPRAARPLLAVAAAAAVLLAASSDSAAFHRSFDPAAELAIAVVGARTAAPRTAVPAAARAPAQALAAASRAGKPFAGTPAVGALFSRLHGHLRHHFCTASVVRSPAGNLLITAAHCVQHKNIAAGTVVFAPGYHSGRFPHGVWRVTAKYVNRQWALDRDPNDDVAFLIAGRRGSRIQRHTGAETLDTDQRLPVQVQVIGYPDAAGRPITCTAPARSFAPGRLRQLRFRCDKYTDGTSGGPFLARVSSKTGDGAIIGVIGGYQQGGDSPDVSYSSRFLANVRALYRAVISGQAAPAG